jgi:hypothetical protein
MAPRFAPFLFEGGKLTYIDGGKLYFYLDAHGSLPVAQARARDLEESTYLALGKRLAGELSKCEGQSGQESATATFDAAIAAVGLPLPKRKAREGDTIVRGAKEVGDDLHSDLFERSDARRVGRTIRGTPLSISKEIFYLRCSDTRCALLATAPPRPRP